MRLIDADALEKEGWSLHRTIRVDKNTSEYQTKPLKQVPTIEPERKKGKWIPQDFNKHNGMVSTAVYYYPKCSVCGNSADYTNFCPNCGADMRGDNDDQSK